MLLLKCFLHIFGSKLVDVFFTRGGRGVSVFQMRGHLLVYQDIGGMCLYCVAAGIWLAIVTCPSVGTLCFGAVSCQLSW